MMMNSMRSLLQGAVDTVWGGDVETETTPTPLVVVRNWVKFGVHSPKTKTEEKQMLVLWGMVVAVVLLCLVAPEVGVWFLNPWQFDPVLWFTMFSLKTYLLQWTDIGITLWMKKKGQPMLPHMDTPYAQEQLANRRLKPIDFFFFRVNAIVDMWFLSLFTWTAYMVTTLPPVSGGMAWYVLQSVVMMPVMMLAADSMYAVLHWAMHSKLMYEAVHLPHHEIRVPEQTLVDVRTYHPLEIALSSATLILPLYIPGVTALSAFIGFSMQVVINCLNHGEWLVKLEVWGRTLFHTGNHHVHHMYPTRNMGILSMLTDLYVLGTYRPYKEMRA